MRFYDAPQRALHRGSVDQLVTIRNPRHLCAGKPIHGTDPASIEKRAGSRFLHPKNSDIPLKDIKNRNFLFNNLAQKKTADIPQLAENFTLEFAAI